MYSILIKRFEKYDRYLIPIGAIFLALSFVVMLIFPSKSDEKRVKGQIPTHIAIPMLVGIACWAMSMPRCAPRLFSWWSIRFGDRLEVDQWPRPLRSYAWEDVGGIARYNRKITVKQTEYWMPIVVPGAEFAALLTVEAYRYVQTEIPWYRIVDRQKKLIVEFQPTSQEMFTIVEWQHRKSLLEIVKYFGGEIEFQGSNPKRISLRKSSITSEQWQELLSRLVILRGLEELDLSLTNLDDAALDGAEGIADLKRIESAGSRIASSRVKRLFEDIARAKSERFIIK